MNSEKVEEKPGLKERFWEEMRLYGFLTAYLFISFSVLMMYGASFGDGEHTSTIQYSVALVQALVIGKFLLIGKAMGVGNRNDASHLFQRVAWRTLTFIFVLVIFKIIEELIIGWVHGESTATVLGEFGGKGWMATVSPILMMTLLLIPLAAFVELKRALGSDQFAALMKGQ